MSKPAYLLRKRPRLQYTLDGKSWRTRKYKGNDGALDALGKLSRLGAKFRGEA